MGIIKKLDQHVTNLIAAGEVIEKVSSVVKELVENSIDALATNISISLTEGGLKEIVVSDNGKGMDEADAQMCILPYATSKISKEEDLFNIHTLGFRGEALASIVAVSLFKMKTCTKDSKGIMLTAKDGKIVSMATISHPVGTEISVRNLFYNTPPRLQSLKNEATELSGVVDYVSRIALAKSQIAFKLTNNNKVIFQTFGNGSRSEAIACIYGTNVAKNMLAVRDNCGSYRIYGLVSNISSTRSSKNFINIIVNGRMIKNPRLINAVCQGYQTFLMVGRYPIAVIEIIIEPNLVDVNAHPSKLEVRFANEDSIAETITRNVQIALSRDNLTVSLDEDIPINNEDVFYDYTTEENDNKVFEDNDVSSEVNNNIYLKQDYDFDDFKDSTPKNEEIEVSKPEQKPIIVSEPKKETFTQQKYNFVNDDINNLEQNKNRLPKLFYIGQLFGTYLLAQNEGEFFLIDQHAANERINYEKILTALKAENNINYELLIPLKLDFTAAEAILIEEKMPIINNLGIELDDFGGGTYMVRKLPYWIIKGQEKEFTEEIIVQIINNRKQEKYQFMDSLAKSLACKKSVKANDYLSQIEIDYLLDDLAKCDNPFTCPHGRPTIVKFSKYELEKWFKRA